MSNNKKEIEELRRELDQLKYQEPSLIAKYCLECKHETCHQIGHTITFWERGSPKVKFVVSTLNCTSVFYDKDATRCLNCGKVWQCEKHYETVEVKES